MSREQIIAELQRRGVSIPSKQAQQISSAVNIPQVDDERQAIIQELQRRGVAPTPTPTPTEQTRSSAITQEVANLPRGLGRGFANVVSGLLQTGTDILGAQIPDSEKVQQFRELLAQAQQRGQKQFEAQTEGSITAPVGEFIGEVGLPTVGAIAVSPAITGTLGAAAARYPALGRAGAAIRGIAGRVPTPFKAAGAGALGGAIGAGIQPTEEIQPPEEALAARKEAAETGAQFGAAVSPLAKPAVASLGALGRGIGRLVKGQNADKILAGRLSPLQVPELRLQLQKAGKESIAILPDIAGDEIKGLTRAIGKIKGGARDIVSDALESRSEDAVRRISNVLSRNISNVEEYRGSLDDFAKARAQIAAPIYRQAYEEAREIDREKLNKLLQDQRIINALDRAKKDFGVKIEANANTLEALDGAKKVLDDEIGEALRINRKQRAASFLNLKKQLVEELDAASPRYKKARQIFSDFSSLINAQELGNEFSKRTPEELRRIVKTLDNSQRAAFKIGVRENLQNTINKVAEGADPAKRIFGNTHKKEQLRAIFENKAEFDRFSKKLREEISGAETKFKVLRGSRTDINLTDDADFINAASNAVRQGDLGITRKLLDATADALEKRYIGLNNKNARDLAIILTDRSKGIEALKRIEAAQNNARQRMLITNFIKDLSSQPAIVGLAAGQSAAVRSATDEVQQP